MRETTRAVEGRAPKPSASVIDSQSVKTTLASEYKGYDAGKKVKGRKRHSIVDTIGLLLHVVVHGANIQDRDGAKQVLQATSAKQNRLQLVWADGGYTGKLISWVKERCQWTLQIVKRNEFGKFIVLPRRWVVERTFSWIDRCRRLSKDYERNAQTSENMIYLAMIRILLKRLANAN